MAAGADAMPFENDSPNIEEKKMTSTSHYRQAIIASALIAAATAAQAVAPYENESLVRARVIHSQPIYQTINEPRTECWTETVGYEGPRHRNEGSGGAVLGAIAGGLIGSTVGRGNGRVAAAAVGAATGAVVGDRMDARSEGPRQIERCQTIDNPRRVVSGYDVRYRYQGHDYNTQLPYDPGRFLNLRVSVSVAEDQRERGEGWDHHDDDRDER
jgi:uncharacterized protein YcfJ